MSKVISKKKILIVITTNIIVLFVVTYFIYFLLNLFKKPSKLYTKISSNKFSIIEKDLNIIDFVKPFKDSCNVFKHKNPNSIVTYHPVTTRVRDWIKICELFNKQTFESSADIYSFFKNNFDIYIIKGKNEAHITGYYRIVLDGSLTKSDIFKYPIYKVPPDLISVNLGNFIDELKGRTIFGRISNNRLLPYYTREEINNGILENKNLEIVWVDNKYSAFLLHVQGSGLVKVNNKSMYLSYSAKNGHSFKGIYNYIKQKGYLKNSKLKGMNAIYDFFENHPDKIDEVLNINPSYIFFKEVNINDWVAALGTKPYKERTVAVDPKFIPLGVPLIVNINDNNKSNLVRLVVANDTGSSIKGLTRVDFYWGLGKEAGKKAEATNSKGDLYLLLPKV